MSEATTTTAALRARRIDLTGTENLRDVGGYPTRDGARIRDGVLLRADSLHGLDADGRAALAALGLRTVIDLREPRERAAFPTDLDGLGARLVHVPLIGGSDADLPRGPSWTLADGYMGMLERGDRLAAAVRAIAAPAAVPALVHCMGGKDRTGLVVAFALAAVGVPEPIVVADFGASALFLGEDYRRAAVDRAVARGIDRPMAERIAECRPEHLEAVLAAVGASHGGPASYLRAHGLSEVELEALRAAITERR